MFANWSDGGAQAHTITTPSAPATYTANFTSQHYLTTAASPAAGGTISPASGWFSAGTQVQVSAAPNSGYLFGGFTGDLSGVTTPQTVTVNAPKSVTANFSIVLPTYSISGQVTRGGVALPGATVTLSGSSAGFRTTDALGNYSFAGLVEGGNYTVTPSGMSSVFTPPAATFNNLGANQTANFTADFAPIRVNAGGGPYTDPSGNLWAADTGYGGGSTWSTSAGIANTTTPPLYQSERFGTSPLQYQFNGIPAGTYTVKLKFAEVYFGSPGQRVFNIALNSQTVQTGFDIVAAAGGGFKAVDLSFPLTVSGGQIVIRLTPVVENPKISAIEIVPAGADPIPVAVSVSPASASVGPSQSRQFTATVTGTANSAVTWSLNPAVGTVSAAGLYTAPATVTIQQTVTVTATSVADPTKTGSAAVTLAPVVAVAVSPPAATLNASQSQQFTATVTGTVNTAVTWSLNPAVGSVSAAGLYTAPATVTIQQTVTVTATSVADPTKTASGVVTLTPPPAAFTPIRVNAGGGAYTDPGGNLWAADTGYNGGATYITPAAIANTTTPALYQSERYSASPLQYQFNGIPAGTYTVKLKFAEVWLGSPGQRVFNIALNSQTVQTGFDIVAAAGGAFRAVDLSFPVTVSAGQIVIRLTAVVENPKISAIEIVLAGGSPIAVSVGPVTASLGPSQSQQFTATVTGTANTAVTWSLNPGVGSMSAAGLYTAPATVTVQQTVTVTATSVADPAKTASGAVTLVPPPPAFTPIRVNAGGGAYTDPSGNLWVADTGYSGGSTWSTSAGIANTTTPVLYRSERYSASPLQYQFNGIPAGTYTVKLKFAEVWFGSPGQRVFNIALNSQTVQTDFDIVAAAGGAFRAVDLSFPVTVSAGQIVIRLTAVVENPKISAIEIQ